MEYPMISILDRKANAYNRPIAVNAIGQAIRSFQDEINRDHENNEMFRHPGDFDLYHLGFWNDETGKFESFEMPRRIAIGEELSTTY